jgi:hypothetical protein
MAVETISQLPQIFALGGNELFIISQPQTPPTAVPWVSYAVSISTIKSFIQGTGAVVGTCTMRQLKAALAAQSVMVQVYDALPSDITNQYNIAWASGATMTLTDPFTTGFLQPTLGYSAGQMTALFALALTFPA